MTTLASNEREGYNDSLLGQNRITGADPDV